MSAAGSGCPRQLRAAATLQGSVFGVDASIRQTLNTLTGQIKNLHVLYCLRGEFSGCFSSVGWIRVIPDEEEPWGLEKAMPKDVLRPSAVPEAEAEESFLSEEMATLRLVKGLANDPQEKPASS